jgi:hypothetical protein
MRRLVPVLCGGVLAAVLCGCASQRTESREWYEPTPTTMQTRKDGQRIGALKSETIKSGQPDWSGNKTFSLFSW